MAPRELTRSFAFRGWPRDYLASFLSDGEFVAEQLRAQALGVWLLPPDEFREHIRAEAASWARIIKSRNITAE